MRVLLALLVDLHVTVFTHDGAVMIGEAFLDDNDNGIRDDGETYNDIDGSRSYTDKLTRATATQRVDGDIQMMNERYAQAGVRFVRSDINFTEIDVGLADGQIDLSEMSPDGDENLSADERLLFVTNDYSSDADADIEIYYVPRIRSGADGIRAWAFPDSWYQGMSTPDLNDSILIPNNAGFYSASHEPYHVFSQTAAHTNAPNLVATTTGIVQSGQQQVADTRRLTNDQETVIHDSEYADDPLVR